MSNQKLELHKSTLFFYKQYLRCWSFFSKYAWVIPLKDKNDIIITNTSLKT